MNLGPVFQSIGQVSDNASSAYITAQKMKLDQLMASLKAQQGNVDLQESQERLKRLKASPDSEQAKLDQQFAAYEKVLGRKLTDDEKKTILGLPAQAKPQNITNEFEAWREAFKARTGAYPTDEQIDAHHKAEQKGPAPTKPIKDNTYDPSGHLRSAFLDPQTGEVVAWGPLVPEREAFHYITDQEGNVHAVRMPTMRAITPGEIRQTEKAASQWEQIAPKEHKPLPTKMVNPDTGKPAAGGSPKSDIIGQSSPKYAPPLAQALKGAQGAYKNWVGAMENSHYHTPKTDLAIVFAAVRAQVEGAGRMTNTELDRETKAGSFGDRFQRWYESAQSGTLPDDQRQDLLNVIRNSWMSSAETARSAWESDMSGKPMPSYIKADDLDDLTGKVKP